MDAWSGHDCIAINAAVHLDNVRTRREGNENDSVDFQQIDKFVEKASSHVQIMKEMLAANNYYPSGYLFYNPIIESIKKFYGVSLQDYQDAKRTQCSDFVTDMRTGLEMVLESFEVLDFHPTTIPIQEINALRDFCLMVSDTERIAQSPYIYRCAA